MISLARSSPVSLERSARSIVRGTLPLESLSLDRAAGGRWLATDGRTLRVSTDDGRTFEERLAAPGIVRVRARRDGRSALLLGALGVWEWEVEADRTRPVPELAELWALDLLRRGRSWWLLGAELARRSSPARGGAARGTASAWIGPGVVGWVFASDDEGRNWRPLVRTPGAAVLAGDVGRRGELAVLDASGRVHLPSASEGAAALASLGRATPLAARAEWLEWDGAGRGRVGGRDARGQERVLATEDGGASWRGLAAASAGRGATRRARLRKGARLRVAGEAAELSPPAGPAVRWPLPATCTDLLRDALGAGLLVLADGGVRIVRPEHAGERR